MRLWAGIATRTLFVCFSFFFVCHDAVHSHFPPQFLRPRRQILVYLVRKYTKIVMGREITSFCGGKRFLFTSSVVSTLFFLHIKSSSRSEILTSRNPPSVVESSARNLNVVITDQQKPSGLYIDHDDNTANRGNTLVEPAEKQSRKFLRSSLTSNVEPKGRIEKDPQSVAVQKQGAPTCALILLKSTAL